MRRKSSKFFKMRRIEKSLRTTGLAKRVIHSLSRWPHGVLEKAPDFHRRSQGGGAKGPWPP